MPAALGRLRKRSEFLAVAATNRRSATPGLVLQARSRLSDGLASDGLAGAEPALRVGFTATKKIGNAVKRNRARRRLRAAVREVLANINLPPTDLVLIARHGTIDRGYTALKQDIAVALDRLRLGRTNPGP